MLRKCITFQPRLLTNVLNLLMAGRSNLKTHFSFSVEEVGFLLKCSETCQRLEGAHCWVAAVPRPPLAASREGDIGSHFRDKI